MIITRCRYQMFNKSLLLAHWGISSRLCLQTCSLCAFLTDCRQETVEIGMSAAGEDLPEGSLLISLVHSPEEGGRGQCVWKSRWKSVRWVHTDVSASHAAAQKGRRDDRWGRQRHWRSPAACCYLPSDVAVAATADSSVICSSHCQNSLFENLSLMLVQPWRF